MRTYWKKVGRNFSDYGFGVTLYKCFASLVRLFYEDKTYRVYVIDLKDMPELPFENNDYVFRLLRADEENRIHEIEDMEEWLEGHLKHMLEHGAFCLIAADGVTTAGFNLVSLDEGHLPLIYFTKKLREHEAWSEQITVRKDYRKQHLGSTLRARIFRILRENGVRKLYGGAQPSNIASLRLARSVGFKDIADVRYRRILFKEKHYWKRVKP